MTKNRLVAIIGISVAVIATAVILILYYQNFQNREVGFREPPKFLFNISGKGKNVLGRPSNVAVANGKVFVADSKNGRVQVFSSKGEPDFSFPASKDKKSTDSYPLGITLDNDGQIYVTELRSQKLLVFDGDGNFVSNFPSKKSKLLKKPLAITFANNKLYVTDAGDQKVKVFNKNGKLLLKLGKTGVDKGHLAFPNGVAVLDNGTIFVSDSNNRRIQVFNSKGAFKFMFGADKLALPRGIAVDWLERLHVVDAFGRKVTVFDSRGNLLFSYGVGATDSRGEKESLPDGIAIDNTNRRIYVTDRVNNLVSVWGYP